MLGLSQQQRIAALLPQLQSEDELRSDLAQHGMSVRLPPGREVCREGALCEALALVLDGSARVFKLGESGREITLYRVVAGESCILTASCILSRRPFPAFAVTEDVVEAVLVPASLVQRWMIGHARWRHYIWDLLAGRLADVLSLIEEVAFRRLDERVAEYLLASCWNDAALRTTHQQIAKDLGTSREVISRILKDFEARGLLTLRRGAIELRDSGALRRLAGRAR